MNFDGALFADENTVGVGIIIRNDSGLVMAALTLQILLPCFGRDGGSASCTSSSLVCKGVEFSKLVKVIQKSLSTQSMMIIWPDLSLGIYYKTLLFLAYFLVLSLFAMIKGKIIV